MPIAFVQEADAASGSVTLGASTTAGNTVVVAVACIGATSATGVTGVTLGGSADNFALVTPGPSAQDTTSPNDFINVSVWADPNCAGGSTAIVATGTGVVAAWAYEFSGIAGTADIAQVLPVVTYQDSWTASTGQTTVPAEAWVAITCAANQTASETLTVNNVTNWTVETAHNGTSGTYDWGAVSAYQTVNTVGSLAWAGNFSQPSFSVTVLVTFPMALAGITAAPAVASAISLPSGTIVSGDLTIQGNLSFTASGSPDPSDAGFVAWAYDEAMVTGAGGLLLATGSIYLVKCPVRATATCTGIRVYISAAGNTLTAGQNFAGVYSSTGTRVGVTGDQTSHWASTGPVDAPLVGGPFTISPPFVWAAFVPNGTAGPELAATGAISASWANGRLAPHVARFGVISGAFTSLPSAFSPASIALAASQNFAALY